MANNINIFPISGASAVSTAVSISGFNEKYFFYGFFAILFVLIIRLFSQLFLIRLASNDKGKIGRAYLSDWYLSEKKNGKHQGRYLDIFYFQKSTNYVNSQWLKMWRRALFWIPGGEFWDYVVDFNRKFNGFERVTTSESKKIAYQHLRCSDSGKNVKGYS